MYIIVVGCGRLGNTLANELSNFGHDVCIIARVNDPNWKYVYFLFHQTPQNA